ncbi:transcriptional regulator, LysR family [Peptoanaerobacter stomatis]|uniref:Transcriptional regulator, LysR family n=1 Tax=Peptoanaerobacter stomatis TaxID=796937 RepID=J5WT96_9FIRM|nr:LysR family transcriptional regulator [Peptoanaerobacter stomatis]EJU24227.1 transcriptional regulator, LysR family [Peptoanaerobacter stomatis]NWO25216.1 LysR family transcriptional regulator [Peptostreptococcaceae bacterium oral taxon 081]
MIELYLLENLYAVYEHKTLTLAAEKLHLTQPSLSRSMQKLEGILEVSLFDRQKNRINLNENGVLAAQYAKKILDSEKEMIESIRAFDLQNLTISIGSCAPGPLYLLPAHISKLYPNTHVTSCMDTEKNLIHGLKNYTFSLIILTQPVEDEKIFSVKFVTEKLNINLTLNHPFAKYEVVSFKEVDGQNFIMYDKVGIWEDIVRKNMPNSRFFTQNDLDAVGEIARLSNFPAFSSNISLSFEPSRQENRLNIPFSDNDATITFYLCCLSNNRSKLEKLFNSLDIFTKFNNYILSS